MIIIGVIISQIATLNIMFVRAIILNKLAPIHLRFEYLFLFFQNALLWHILK